MKFFWNVFARQMKVKLQSMYKNSLRLFNDRQPIHFGLLKKISHGLHEYFAKLISNNSDNQYTYVNDAVELVMKIAEKNGSFICRRQAQRYIVAINNSKSDKIKIRFVRHNEGTGRPYIMKLREGIINVVRWVRALVHKTKARMFSNHDGDDDYDALDPIKLEQSTEYVEISAADWLNLFRSRSVALE